MLDEVEEPVRCLFGVRCQVGGQNEPDLDVHVAASVLAEVSYVSVIDRAPGFGSLGPLGADVKSLGLPRARAVTNFICGLGGVDVTPATLRWALMQTRAGTPSDTPVYVPEGV